tara:strand:+ start:155 stop:766 length:612 start_codon:yes stop_codon:yes gene_type:complete
MCDPTTQLVLSAVAQGAGVAAQNRAAKKAQQQQALLMRENKTRNRALEDQQAAAIQEAVNAASASATQPGIEAAGNQLSEILKAALTQRNMQTGVTGRSAPKVFMDQKAASEAAAMMKARADAENLAKLNATNRYLTQTITPKIADAAASGMLTGNFVRGNANVLDTGMKAAQSLAYSPLAQTLQGAGRVGLGYSLYDPDKEA